MASFRKGLTQWMAPVVLLNAQSLPTTLSNTSLMLTLLGLTGITRILVSALILKFSKNNLYPKATNIATDFEEL